MKINDKKRYIRILVLLVGLLLLLAAGLKWSYRGKERILQAEIFYFNPCESCREHVRLDKELRGELAQAGVEASLSCHAYNVFKEADMTYMEKRMEELGLEIKLDQLPAVLIDGKLYPMDGKIDSSGTAQNISGTAPEESAEDRLPVFGETDTVLLLFVTFSCDGCESVENYLDSTLPNRIPVRQGSDSPQSDVRLLKYNILEGENLALLDSLMKHYDVPSKEQQVPILFYRGGYLSGESGICGSLAEILESGNVAGFDASLLEAGFSPQTKARETGKDLLNASRYGQNGRS